MLPGLGWHDRVLDVLEVVGLDRPVCPRASRNTLLDDFGHTTGRFPISDLRLNRGLLAYIDTPPTKTGRSRRYPNQFSSGLEDGQFMKPFAGWYT